MACRIWFNYNLVHSAEEALPPETVLQLIRLHQLSFSENPLLSNPLNLLLLPRDNTHLLHSVLLSLKQVSNAPFSTTALLRSWGTQVPVWWGDPCTPYIWYLHLVADGGLTQEGRDFYAKLFPAGDPGEGLSDELRGRCQESYREVMSRLSHYQVPPQRPSMRSLKRLGWLEGLVVTGRCETVRRLRSLDDRFQAQQTRIHQAYTLPSHP